MRPAAFFSLLALLLAAAAAGCAPPPDPAAAEAHRMQAEQLIHLKEYPAALDELALAIELAPATGEHYLRRGEVLEALDRSDEAAAVYRQGRSAVDPASASLPELTYRLALHAALGDRDIDRAATLAAELPSDSVRFHHLQGAIALAEERPREALVAFNRALAGEIPQPVASRLLLHAAMAYHRLGAREKTFATLYRAINQAGNLGVARQIEVFWERVKQPASWEPKR